MLPVANPYLGMGILASWRQLLSAGSYTSVLENTSQVAGLEKPVCQPLRAGRPPSTYSRLSAPVVAYSRRSGVVRRAMGSPSRKGAT